MFAPDIRTPPIFSRSNVTAHADFLFIRVNEKRINGENIFSRRTNRDLTTTQQTQNTQFQGEPAVTTTFVVATQDAHFCCQCASTNWVMTVITGSMKQLSDYQQHYFHPFTLTQRTSWKNGLTHEMCTQPVCQPCIISPPLQHTSAPSGADSGLLTALGCTLG